MDRGNHSRENYRLLLRNKKLKKKNIVLKGVVFELVTEYTQSMRVTAPIDGN